MGHTFGIFTNSQKNVTFGKMKAQVVEGETNPNHPENPESPNKPRIPRYPGYQNPILGDDGNGKIGRFQSINIDALEVVIEQIIEQYLRDKSWYGKVRCREALWNMYHRLEWWVKQQIDPSKNDYQRALQMMKDCINHILTEAQDNVSLPLCPVPYDMPWHGDYFNHYDGQDIEIKLFDSRDLPRSDDFPGLFRYVSSAEDQEWELIHSLGVDEMQGNETILKLSLNQLLFSNSSKVTFNWRFKKRGFIRFKYIASTAAGNGLTFFINNNQVGGEWNKQTDWQEVKFNVQPGQTYKFDWLVRKQNEIPWGNEAIYIKDIECIEVIKSLEAPTPPDYDTLGRDAYGNGDYDWITYSKSSVIRTHFDGLVSDLNRDRSLSFNMSSECDGVLSFAYRMNATEPVMAREYYLFYSDDLTHQTQQSTGHHGSTMNMSHDGRWAGDGAKFETTQDTGKITYDLVVGPACSVDMTGTLEIICPIREIDHYEPTEIQHMADAYWSAGGQWTGSNTTWFRVDNPVAGTSDLSSNVTLQDDGWFTFSYQHDLRPSESLQVLVDGELAYYSDGQRSNNATVPLKAGSHTITFRLQDNYTEADLKDTLTRTYYYGHANTGKTFTTTASLGSSSTVTRNWDMTDSGAETFTNGSTIQYQVQLNPGASFSLSETLEFMPNPNLSGASTQVFTANFNTEGNTNGVSMVGNWKWQDILTRQGNGSGDGVYKVEGVTGDHTAHVGVSLASGGNVTFEYGGIYGPYDYMELRIGSTKIWQGQVSSDADYTPVSVALPAGSYTLTWLYHCAAGGTSQTTPSDTEQPTNPNNEVCFPGGSSAVAVNYSLAKQSTTTARGTKFSTGGSSFYTSSTLQAAETDGAVISRDIIVSAIDNAYYQEQVLVQQGAASDVQTVVLTPARKSYKGPNVNVSNFFDNPYVDSNSLTMAGIGLGNEAGAETEYFETTGQLYFHFDWKTHLENKNPVSGRTSKPGQQARYHGEFNVYLISESGTSTRVFQITKDDQGHFALTKVVAAGRYKVRLTLKDTVDDYDSDDQGVYYGATFSDVKVHVPQTVMSNNPDGTKVKVELLDKSTGSVLQSTYATSDTATQISYSCIAGHSYQVRYTLEKGKGTTGGLYGRGGSFSVKNGELSEYWSGYCTSNGKYYPDEQSTQRPPDPGTVVLVPATPGAWGWLDAIKVFSANNPICSDTYVEVMVSDGSTLIEDRIYNNHQAAQTMQTDIMNSTDGVKVYSITQSFHSTCGDGARVRNGKFIINDNLPPPPSYAMITAYAATNNKTIWIGGCDSSSITVTMTDEIGTVLYSEKFTGSGPRSFNVSDLAYQPYSKYRLLIETDQLGVVSAYTGKSYMSAFRLLDLKAYEKWQNVPDPFAGKLDFFINGELKGSYTEPGGFFEVSFPISKGNQTLEWVFTEPGDGNTYDQCEIDFLKITNWICDKVKVVPYCQPGGGDKCVEELIKCLLKMWNDRPKACVIGKTIWLFT